MFTKGMFQQLYHNLSLNLKIELKKLKSNPDYLKISLSVFPKAYNQTHEGGDINL